jgi:hypothetical protein
MKKPSAISPQLSGKARARMILQFPFHYTDSPYLMAIG